MAEPAHSTNVSRRQLLVGAAALAVAGVASGAGFDAAAYVDMWRRHGNVVSLSERGEISIYLGDGKFPPYSEIRAFDAVTDDKAACSAKVTAYLRAEEAAEV